VCFFLSPSVFYRSVRETDDLAVVRRTDRQYITWTNIPHERSGRSLLFIYRRILNALGFFFFFVNSRNLNSRLIFRCGQTVIITIHLNDGLLKNLKTNQRNNGNTRFLFVVSLWLYFCTTRHIPVTCNRIDTFFGNYWPAKKIYIYKLVMLRTFRFSNRTQLIIGNIRTELNTK